MNTIKFLIISVTLVALCGCQQDEKDGNAAMHHEINELAVPTELNLTPQFQEVLKKEMLEIQSAMQDLLPAIAKGESEKTVKLAEQIHNSFILKTALTPEELKQLVKLLPAHFVKTDRAFHSDAAKLSQAAKKYDFKKSAQIYGEMINACVNCHSSFATEQFPGLQKSTSTH